MSKDASIIALDLALNTGVARQESSHLTTMVWDLKADEQRPVPNRSVGPAIRIGQHLDVEHNQQTLQRVVFESAYTIHSAQAWLQNSLQTAVMLWCYRHGVKWSRYKPTEWKKATVGFGNMSKDKYHHLARKRWPELDVQTDDEAAALWLLEMCKQEMGCDDPQSD